MVDYKKGVHQSQFSPLGRTSDNIDDRQDWASPMFKTRTGGKYVVVKNNPEWSKHQAGAVTLMRGVGDKDNPTAYSKDFERAAQLAKRDLDEAAADPGNKTKHPMRDRMLRSLPGAVPKPHNVLEEPLRSATAIGIGANAVAQQVRNTANRNKATQRDERIAKADRASFRRADVERARARAIPSEKLSPYFKTQRDSARREYTEEARLRRHPTPAHLQGKPK